jgi:hypothetical protein
MINSKIKEKLKKCYIYFLLLIIIIIYINKSFASSES